MIEIIGMPQSGVQKLGLRKTVCKLGEQVSVQEGRYAFSQSYRHRCSIVGGNSGSAVFSRENYEIVAVNNTAVNDNSIGQEACSLNRPCEITKSGEKNVYYKENYAQPVIHLKKCFNAEGIFDKELTNCPIKEQEIL